MFTAPEKTLVPSGSKRLHYSCNTITDLEFENLIEGLKTNSLIKLTLRKAELTALHTQQLAEWIKCNTSLTYLDLGENNLGDDSVHPIAEALTQNTSLTEINLSNNKITDASMFHVAKVLKKNKHLKSLDLSRNELSALGVSKLAKALDKNTVLTRVILGSNQIGDEGLRELCSALKSNATLRELNLEFIRINDASMQDLSGFLIKNTTLKELDLTGNELTGEGIEVLVEGLKNHVSLTKLSLQYNSIDNRGAKALADLLNTNNRITSLNLSNNKITNEGLGYLAQTLANHSNLQHLLLDFNRFDHGGVNILAEGLAHNTGLLSLSLSGNNLGNEGAMHVGKLLETNTTLSELNLCSNEISQQGIKHLSKAIASNRTLIELGLLNNQLDDSAIKILVEALKNNYLGISSCSILVENQVLNRELYAYLKRNKEIKDCFDLLHIAIEKDLLIEDKKQITWSLHKLILLIPNLDSLPKESYPAEVCRLLCALEQRLSMKRKQQLDALKLLLPGFYHSSLQTLADKAMGLLLLGDLYDFISSLNLKREGQLLGLYALRNHLHAPEIRNFVSIVFFHLLHGNKIPTFSEKQKLEATTLIFSQHELIELIQSALTHSKNSEESLLLNHLLSAPDAVNLYSLSSSPAFTKVLKAKFPEAQTFTTVTHCLLAASNHSPLTVSIPENPEFSPERVFAFQSTQTIEEVVAELKNSFINALSPLQEHSIFEDDNDLLSVLIPAAHSIQPDTEPKAQVIEEDKPYQDNEQKLALFIRKYKQQLAKDQESCCFGFFRKSRLELNKPNLQLQDVFNHALHNHGHRTRRVLEELKWLDAAGKIKEQASSPAIEDLSITP